MARSKFQPTTVQREVVKALLRCGVPIDACLPHVINPETGKPLSYNTFNRAFTEEIATAVSFANAMVTRNLYRIATAPSANSATVQACTFWLRSKAGWKFAEGHTPELPDAGEGMVETEEAAQRFIDDAVARYGRRVG